MLRLIGFAVVAGVMIWGGYRAYSWYESRTPSPVSRQEAGSRVDQRNPDLRPSATQALSMFKGIASEAQQAVGMGSNPAQNSGNVGAVYYSPYQNLEAIDYNAIVSSRCTHLDIAEYAFTDRDLAKAVALFARSGRPVRIYRDHDQYEQELKRGSQVNSILRVPNVAIRVKNSSELMHQKAWSDGCVLREGSANWSPGGEKKQDNTLTFLTDPISINNYERVFQAMWDRPDNIVVQ